MKNGELEGNDLEEKNISSGSVSSEQGSQDTIDLKQKKTIFRKNIS